jgi:hypothetical protein
LLCNIEASAESKPYELARRLLHTVRKGIGPGHRPRGVPQVSKGSGT